MWSNLYLTILRRCRKIKYTYKDLLRLKKKMMVFYVCLLIASFMSPGVRDFARMYVWVALFVYATYDTYNVYRHSKKMKSLDKILEDIIEGDTLDE